MTAQIARERLQQLEEQVLALGSQVEGILIEAAHLLHRSDLDALEQLGHERRQVQKQRLAIEMGCLSLIAGCRPRDAELRSLVAGVEIAAGLELLADHAERVVRANYFVADHQLRKPLASLGRLAVEVQTLLSGALAAFARRDAGGARAVAASTWNIEAHCEQVRHDLLSIMMNKPRIASEAIFLSRSAYNLRRAAQRVTGICEWVVFAVEGSLGTGEPVTQVTRARTEETSIAL